MGYLFCTCLFLFFISLLGPTTAEESASTILNAADCPLLRVRRRWGDLSKDEKANFIKAVKLTKQITEKPEPNCKSSISLYNMMVAVHAWNETLMGSNTVWAHSGVGFLPWHRYFLWIFECLLREVATQYNKNLTAQGITTGYMNPCIAIPFWDWENDCGKESQASVWGNETFGNPTKGCVTVGPFSDWIDSNGRCLMRTNSGRGYGGIQTGPASLMTIISTSPSMTAFHNAMIGHPHSDTHLFIGGTSGSMSGMASPDDPLFWIHHCNIDKAFALWQDCYDYDKVPESALTDSIFPASWTVSYIYGTDTIAAKRSDPMPYYYLELNPAKVATRFQPVPTAAQMLYMGTETTPGFNKMYYKYGGPDALVTSMDSSFPGMCKFDTLVNYIPPTQKRVVESKFVFNSDKLQQQLDRIGTLWTKRTPKQKLNYLALWECALSNRDPARDYNSIPTDWLKMNGQKNEVWKTLCQVQGYLNGYDSLANLEDGADSVIPMTTSNIIIILCSVLGVLIIVGVISFLLYTRKQSADTEVLDVNEALTEPMLEDEE